MQGAPPQAALRTQMCTSSIAASKKTSQQLLSLKEFFCKNIHWLAGRFVNILCCAAESC
jgi:hypothetical protein